MKKLSIAWIILSLVWTFSFAANAQNATRPDLKFDIFDSEPHADEGVLRVSGMISGMPNSSCRIDKVELVKADGTSFVANDMDGVDLERYFQWDEDGVIPVEIDFPGSPVPTADAGDKILFHCVGPHILEYVIED